MYTTGPTMLIQDCLANILECTTSVYQEQIYYWLEQNSADLLMIEKWLVVRGILLSEYQQILGNQGALDGLEVWAASMAFDQPINVVPEDSVWGTTHNSIDFTYPTFLLSDYDKFVPCALSCEDVDQLAVAAPLPTSPTLMVERSKGGQPLMSIPEYVDQVDSEHEDTDPDTLLTTETVARLPLTSTGEAIPRACLVCEYDLVSGMALYRHLWSEHPSEKLYSCNSCQNSFNNLKELSSHRSNVHWPCNVSCNKCNYTTITRAKM